MHCARRGFQSEGTAVLTWRKRNPFIYLTDGIEGLQNKDRQAGVEDGLPTGLSEFFALSFNLMASRADRRLRRKEARIINEAPKFDAKVGSRLRFSRNGRDGGAAHLYGKPGA